MSPRLEAMMQTVSPRPKQDDLFYELQLPVRITFNNPREDVNSHIYSSDETL